MLHCLALTRPVLLRALLSGELAEGARAVVRLRFVYGAEFVLAGAHVVLWDSPRGAAQPQAKRAARGEEGSDEERAIGVGVALCLYHSDESDEEGGGSGDDG